MKRAAVLRGLFTLFTTAKTYTVAASCFGVSAVHSVLDEQLTLVASAVPNLNFVAPAPVANPLPVIFTDVPPVAGPLVGLTLVTVGVNLKWSLVVVALVPALVVTVTSTTPAVSAGAFAVIVVAEVTVKDDALTLPKCTAVAPVKPVPEIVTEVPPVVGPLFGVTPVTVGFVPPPDATRCRHVSPSLLHSC